MLKAMVTALVLVLAAPAAALAAQLGDDGLHKEDWFAVTFRDIAEDMAAAKAAGKRLAIVFEQRGCIYCAAMHEKLLADPAVRDYIQAHFLMVQYNMFGDEEVTDLDGEVLTEKSAARKWGYLFTPTVVFLPEAPPGAIPVSKAAVATMPGAFGKWTFLHMFQWVSEKGYDGAEHFQAYHARLVNELRAAGRLDAE